MFLDENENSNTKCQQMKGVIVIEEVCCSFSNLDALMSHNEYM